MAVRSSVLGALILADLNTHTLLTCPSGVTYIVKDYRFQNSAASAASVFLLVQRASGINGWIFSGSVNASATAGGACWVVMQPGDQLRAATGVQPVSLWVSGTRLDGVAVVP